MRKNSTDTNSVSSVIGIVFLVAITVTLASAVGLLVSGIGEEINAPANAGISVEQDGNSVSIFVDDVGNLDGLKIIDPSGSTTATFRRGEILEVGTRIEIRKGGFPQESVTPAIEPEGKPMDLVNGGVEQGNGINIYKGMKTNLGDGSGGVLDTGVFRDIISTDDVTVNESCRVVSSGVIRGIDINGLNSKSTSLRPHIGCSMRNLQGYLADNRNSGFGPFFVSGDTPLVGDDISSPDSRSGFEQKVRSIDADVGTPISYSEGVYTVIGISDGNQNVIRTFSIE